MRDWNIWYKDYYSKVRHCPSKTVNTKQKRKCGRFRVCKRYCESEYGMDRCRVRCRFKRNSIPRFMKVIYRIKRSGLCTDSVICVYESKCNEMWPQYIQRGCYYTYDFNEWWKVHKKDYETKKPSSPPSILVIDKKCKKIENDGPVSSKLETVVKVRMSNGRLYFKIGDLWVHVRLRKKKLFYNIGRKWIAVKFKFRHQYFKIGDKWIRIAVAKRTIYSKIGSLWTKIKILFGKFFIKFGEKWTEWKITKGKYYLRIHKRWIEFKVFGEDVYFNINDSWFKIRQGKFNIEVNLGGDFRKIIPLHGKTYIQFAKRWFQFVAKKEIYSIKFDKTWRKLSFKNRKIFIHINNYLYPIRFRSVYVFIRINKQWIRMEARNEKLFFRMNDEWVHLKLKGNRVYVKKRNKWFRVYINSSKTLYYKYRGSRTRILLPTKKLDRGEVYSLENFNKIENSNIKKLFGGQWLRHMKKEDQSFYMFQGEWFKLTKANGKIYFSNRKTDEYEIRILGKTLLLKVNKTWLEIKRKQKEFYFYDSNRWIKLKLKNNKGYIQLKNRWVHIIFMNCRKFLKYGKRLLEIKFRKDRNEEFFIKLGDEWFDIKVTVAKTLLRIKKRWTELNIKKNGRFEVLIEGTWVRFKVKKNINYIKIRNKWLEFRFIREVLRVKIGDVFRPIKILGKENYLLDIDGIDYVFDGEKILIGSEPVHITFLDGQLYQYVGEWKIPLKIIGKKLFVKVVDSWIERKMGKDEKVVKIKVDNQEIRIVFDKGILCELFQGEKIPVSIRFKKIYYNLNGSWVRIRLTTNKRIANINGRIVYLKKRQIQRLIREYKLTKQITCRNQTKETLRKSGSTVELKERKEQTTLASKTTVKREKVTKIYKFENSIKKRGDIKTIERIRYITVPKIRDPETGRIIKSYTRRQRKKLIHVITGTPIRSQRFLKKIVKQNRPLPFKTFTSNNVRYVTINKVNLPLKVKKLKNYVQWNNNWYMIIVYEEIVYLYIDEYWTVAIIAKDKILTQVGKTLKPLLVKKIGRDGEIKTIRRIRYISKKRRINHTRPLPNQSTLSKIYKYHRPLPFRRYTQRNSQYLTINNVDLEFKQNNKGDYIKFNDDWYMIIEYEDDVYLNIDEYWTVVSITEEGTFTRIESEWVPFKIEKGKPYVKLANTFREIKRIKTKVHYRFGDLWLPIKKVKSKLFLKIYRKWTEVRLTGGRIFIIKKDTLYEIKFVAKRIYFKIFNKWVETKEEKEKTYFNFNNVWKRATLRTGKPQIKIADKWYKYQYVKDKLLLKINKRWRHIECHFNKIYLFINRKKFLVKFENHRVLIKFFIKWVEVNLNDNEDLVKIGNTFLPIRVEDSKLQFLIDEYWREIFWREGNFYYLVEDVWVVISENPLSSGNEPIFLKNGKQFYRMNDKELPLKGIKKNLYYRLKNKWILIKFLKNKQFHKIGDRFLEIKKEIRKLYYKFGEEWMLIDIVDIDSFDIILEDQRIHVRYASGFWEIKLFNKWYKLKFVENNVFYNLDGKWSQIKVKDKKLVFESKPSEAIYDIGSYLLVEGEWTRLSVRGNKYYYQREGKWIRPNSSEIESTVRINGRNYKVKKVNKKNYIKFGENWLEFKPHDESHISLFISNQWEKMRISLGKVYLQRGKRQLQINFTSDKKVFILINNKSYEIRFEAKSIFVHIDGHWFQLLIKNDHLYLKKKGRIVRIRFIHGKKFFKLGDRWVEVKVLEGNYWILIGMKWTLLEFEGGKTYITKGGKKIGIKFEGSKIYVDVGESWYLLEIKDMEYYIKVEGKWLYFTVVNGNEYTKYGGKRLPIQLNKEGRYLKVGRKWRKFKFIDDNLYIFITNEWTLFQIQNRKEYIVLKERKLRFRYFNGHNHIKIGNKWLRYNRIKSKYYLLIETLWTEFSIESQYIFIHYGGMSFKFRIKKGQMHIKVGDRWIVFRVLESNIQIMLGGKWTLIKFRKGKMNIIKRGLKLRIKFENGDKYIMYLNKWYKFKIKKGLYYVYIEEKWSIMSFGIQKKFVSTIKLMLNQPTRILKQEIKILRKRILRRHHVIKVKKYENLIVRQPQNPEGPSTTDSQQQSTEVTNTVNTEIPSTETETEEQSGKWGRRRYSRRRRRHSRKWRRHSRRWRRRSRRWRTRRVRRIRYSEGSSPQNEEIGDIKSIQEAKAKKVIQDQIILSQIKEFRRPLPFQTFTKYDKQFVKINNVEVQFKVQDNDNYINWAENWYMIIYFNENVYLNINGIWTAVFFTDSGVLTEDNGKWVLLEQDPTSKALIRRQPTVPSVVPKVDEQATVVTTDKDSSQFSVNPKYRVYSRRTVRRYFSE